MARQSARACRTKEIANLDLLPMVPIRAMTWKTDHRGLGLTHMMDITEQRKTYGLFMSLTKWGIISTIALVILMAIFLL